MNEEPKRQFLDGYVGVKFKPVLFSHKLQPKAEELYEVFRSTGGRMRGYGMTPANGGNLSIRHGEGFIVTAAGCNLGCIEKAELIFVEQGHVASEEDFFRGPFAPSSESIMHWLIYRNRPEDRISHSHSFLFISFACQTIRFVLKIDALLPI